METVEQRAERVARLEAARAGRAGENRALTKSSVPAVMLQSGAGGEAISARSAMTIADAYACVRVLADSAASLPLIVYRTRSDGGRERVEDGTGLLLRRPAPATTQHSLIGQLMAHLNLYGNAYVGKFRNAEGHVEQLALMQPDRVRPEAKNGLVLYTVTDGAGRTQTVGPRDVIHVRGLTLDGLIGLSPVKQCRVALGLSSSLAEHGQAFFTNGAMPGGILKVPAGPQADDQMAALDKAWQARHGGARNAHRIAVVQGDVAFEQVGMPLEDAQFIEQRRFSAGEVARIFRVPPWMIGVDAGDSLTYSNVEMQAQAFVTFSLRPWLAAIEQAFSADEELFPAGTYCEFLIDALLRGDSKTRAEVYTAALDPVTGWMTRAEVRRLENLEPEEAHVA